MKPDLEKIVARSRGVAETMSKGVAFLLGKNNIDLIPGFGRLTAPGKLEDVDKRQIQGVPHSRPNRRRVQGYLDALRQAGLQEEAIITGDAFSLENGYRQTKLAVAGPDLSLIHICCASASHATSRPARASAASKATPERRSKRKRSIFSNANTKPTGPT